MKVHIAGLGGVGFHLVTALAKTTDPKLLVCYDTDDLRGGLGHTRLPSASLETPKTEISRGHLFVAWGLTQTPTYVRALFTGNEPDEGDLFVDCTDMDTEPRRTMWENAKKKGARCLRVSYDGKSGTTAICEGLPIFSGQKGGYAETPLLDLSFAAGGMGAFVVRQILAGKLPDHVEFQVSIDELAGVIERESEPPNPEPPQAVRSMADFVNVLNAVKPAPVVAPVKRRRRKKAA